MALTGSCRWEERSRAEDGDLGIWDEVDATREQVRTLRTALREVMRGAQCSGADCDETGHDPRWCYIGIAEAALEDTGDADDLID